MNQHVWTSVIVDLSRSECYKTVIILETPFWVAGVAESMKICQIVNGASNKSGRGCMLFEHARVDQNLETVWNWNKLTSKRTSKWQVSWPSSQNSHGNGAQELFVDPTISIQFNSILFYSVISCSILLYHVLFYSIHVLFYSMPFYSILFYSILFDSIRF